jgi:hypothetical protein
MDNGRVLLVFFCFIFNAPNVEKLILSYLKEFKETKLLDQPFVDFIVSLGCESHLVFRKFSQTIRRVVPTANITWSPGNLHEYPGIYTIWSKAPKYYVIGYSHCRGVTHGRTMTDVVFDVVMKPWEKVLKIFNESSDINRIGFVGSPYGWAWFNFWWARGISLLDNPEPQKTERYYYERYLGLRVGPNCTQWLDKHCYRKVDNFYSLALGRKNEGLTATQASKLFLNFDIPKFVDNSTLHK